MQKSRLLRERLLLCLSRKPDVNENKIVSDDLDMDSALSQLSKSLPRFPALINDKEILDFGCGTGYQSVALARMGAKHVVGVDINKTFLAVAQKLAAQVGVANKVDFKQHVDDSLERRFDIVISQNSMEHFSDPAGALATMKGALKDHGVILITFGPPWFAPFGSHMHFFVKMPWVNIFFDERTIMSVRREFKHDGATRFEDVEGGLNKMTVKKFETLIRESHLQVEYERYQCIKGVDLIAKLPILRELFINQISVIVSRSPSS
jgi:SAM-dependent methyltransferase